MSSTATVDAGDAIDEVLDLLNQLEAVLYDLRRRAQEIKNMRTNEHADRR